MLRRFARAEVEGAGLTVCEEDLDSILRLVLAAAPEMLRSVPPTDEGNRELVDRMTEHLYAHRAILGGEAMMMILSAEQVLIRLEALERGRPGSRELRRLDPAGTRIECEFELVAGQCDAGFAVVDIAEGVEGAAATVVAARSRKGSTGPSRSGRPARWSAPPQAASGPISSTDC